MIKFDLIIGRCRFARNPKCKNAPVLGQAPYTSIWVARLRELQGIDDFTLFETDLFTLFETDQIRFCYIKVTLSKIRNAKPDPETPISSPLSCQT